MKSDKPYPNLQQIFFLQLVEESAEPEHVLKEFMFENPSDIRTLHNEIEEVLGKCKDSEGPFAIVADGTDGQVNTHFDYHDYIERILAIINKNTLKN